MFVLGGGGFWVTREKKYFGATVVLKLRFSHSVPLPLPVIYDRPLSVLWPGVNSSSGKGGLSMFADRITSVNKRALGKKRAGRETERVVVFEKSEQKKGVALSIGSQ